MGHNVTISRPLHDFILDSDSRTLTECFKRHRVTWSLAGPTFHDVGNWYRLWLEDHYRQFLKQQECRRHFIATPNKS